MVYSDWTSMNFSWIAQDCVAGCRGPRTDADLAFLRSLGVGALVRLHETELTTADVEQHGIDDCYVPIPDWTAPSQDDIDRIIEFVYRYVDTGRSVAVSCGAGCGRTGTILGCYLVSTGLSAEAAIQTLIETRPCSREILSVPSQKEAVIEFDRRATNCGKRKDAV